MIVSSWQPGYNVCMISDLTDLTEADILTDLIVPDEPSFTAEAARALLQLRFDTQTTRRIRALLQKNNRGTITVAERLALEKYLRVGTLVDLLQAKARLSLVHSETKSSP